MIDFTVQEWNFWLKITLWYENVTLLNIIVIMPVELFYHQHKLQIFLIWFLLQFVISTSCNFFYLVSSSVDNSSLFLLSFWSVTNLLIRTEENIRTRINKIQRCTRALYPNWTPSYIMTPTQGTTPSTLCLTKLLRCPP